jgi:hypothetical protein
MNSQISFINAGFELTREEVVDKDVLQRQKELKLAIDNFNSNMKGWTTVRLDETEYDETYKEWVLVSNTIEKTVQFYNDWDLSVMVEITARQGGTMNVFVFIDVKHSEYPQDNFNLEDELELNYSFWPEVLQVKMDVQKLVQKTLDQLKTVEFVV